MKRLLITIAVLPTLFLSGCATTSGWFSATYDKYMKQAFGDAIRSLEGTAIADIPKAIQAARQKWLPQGQFWSDFAARQIRAYVAGHPNTPEEAKKVLEAIATGLNLTTT